MKLSTGPDTTQKDGDNVSVGGDDDTSALCQAAMEVVKRWMMKVESDKKVQKT